MSEDTKFKLIQFHKGAIIIEEDSVADSIYLIKSGVVEIRKGKLSDIPRTLARREAGQVVGEMSVFDNSPAMASAVVLEDVEAMAMSREEFHRRLDSMDPILKAMFSMMIDRNREMGELLAKQGSPTLALWK